MSKLISAQKNVLGENLKPCCEENNTGYFRDGFCHVNQFEQGNHSVCAIVSEEFLAFSKSRGNDLTAPSPEARFPGLEPGDKWCLCADRWQEALDAKVAPKVVLSATHQACLEKISLDDLKPHAIDTE